MKISTITIIACLCAGMALSACKGKNKASADTTGINVTKNSQGQLSDSTMGNVPDSSKKNAAPGATGPKANTDSVMKK